MQCPQCKNDVPVTEAQFGALYTCPQCVAVYFVGFDGQPEFGSMDLSIAETTQEFFTPEDVPSTDIPVQTYESIAEAVVDEVEPRAADHLSFTAIAQEITDYGNQEEVISSMSYDVIIKGLDTKEVMQAFKDVIEDSKFAWLTQDILNQIKHGEVKLKNLNPIQAFVLATRIQFLDLEIEWTQNVAF